VRRSLFAACVVAVWVTTTARCARATTCAVAPGTDARLGTIDGRARLNWIEQRLDQEASKGNLWGRGWAIGIGAAGVGSLAPVPFVAASDRIDWYAGAGTAAIGVIPFVVAPLAVTRDAPKLRAAVAGVPPDDDARVCALLIDAEGKLAADAADEKWQQGWWMHAGNVAFNTGVLLFLGLGYHHWTSGAINALSGAAVGEVILATQPTNLIEDAAAYDRGELSGAAHAMSLGWMYGGRF